MHVMITDTPQQIFDVVVTHLAQQKKRSMFNGVCKYRFEEGDHTLKCAIGCLIPDNEYDASIEFNGYDQGMNVSRLMRDGYINVSDLNTRNLLLSLQTAHDTCENVEDLRYDLYNIARNYDLQDIKIRLVTEWS